MNHSDKLTGPWRTIHGAIWLLGLAILFWQGWFWPGILVLIALSGILEAVIQIAVPAAVAPEYREHRPELLPHSCPKCNAPISGDDVRWTGPQSADCPYCGANLPMKEGTSS